MNNTITIYPVTMLDWNEGRQQHWAIGESEEQVKGWVVHLPSSRDLHNVNRFTLGEPLSISSAEEFATHYQPRQHIWYCKNEHPKGLVRDIIRMEYAQIVINDMISDLKAVRKAIKS